MTVENTGVNVEVLQVMVTALRKVLNACAELEHCKIALDRSMERAKKMEKNPNGIGGPLARHASGYSISGMLSDLRMKINKGAISDDEAGKWTKSIIADLEKQMRGHLATENNMTDDIRGLLSTLGRKHWSLNENMASATMIGGIEVDEKAPAALPKDKSAGTKPKKSTDPSEDKVLWKVDKGAMSLADFKKWLKQNDIDTSEIYTGGSNHVAVVAERDESDDDEDTVDEAAPRKGPWHPVGATLQKIGDPSITAKVDSHMRAKGYVGITFLSGPGKGQKTSVHGGDWKIVDAGPNVPKSDIKNLVPQKESAALTGRQVMESANTFMDRRGWINESEAAYEGRAPVADKKKPGASADMAPTQSKAGVRRMLALAAIAKKTASDKAKERSPKKEASRDQVSAMLDAELGIDGENARGTIGAFHYCDGSFADFKDSLSGFDVKLPTAKAKAAYALLKKHLGESTWDNRYFEAARSAGRE